MSHRHLTNMHNGRRHVTRTSNPLRPSLRRVAASLAVGILLVATVQGASFLGVDVPGLTRLTHERDITAEALRHPDVPANAPAPADLAEAIAWTRLDTDDEGEQRVTVLGQRPPRGSNVTVRVDATGFMDDAVLGERLSVITSQSSTGQWTVDRVTTRGICRRGGGRVLVFDSGCL